jgi:protein-S-isoprenylcysteine O-methyltransferase Ste14
MGAVPVGATAEMSAGGLRTAARPRRPSPWIAHRVSGAAVAAMFVSFMAAQVTASRRPGESWTVLLIVAQEALIVVLFLARRSSSVTSRRPLDWALGAIGLFLPFALRPTSLPSALSPVAQPIQICGLVLATAALAFLGRSIGIVAANRGITSAGPFAIVRHPTYAAHTLQYVGYAISYASLANVLVVLATAAVFVARAIVEERLLRHDPAYAGYERRVPWRFVPGVY